MSLYVSWKVYTMTISYELFQPFSTDNITKFLFFVGKENSKCARRRIGNFSLNGGIIEEVAKKEKKQADEERLVESRDNFSKLV